MRHESNRYVRSSNSLWGQWLEDFMQEFREKLHAESTVAMQSALNAGAYLDLNEGEDGWYILNAPHSYHLNATQCEILGKALLKAAFTLRFDAGEFLKEDPNGSA